MREYGYDSGVGFSFLVNAPIAFDLISNREFTYHEHLVEAELIHMNGRTYDAEIGRFMQADPVVQDPGNGQNLNRYTYVLNSPMSYTDPSGYFSYRVPQAAKRSNPFLPLLQYGAAIFTGGQSLWIRVAAQAAVIYATTRDLGATAKGAFISVVSGNVYGPQSAIGAFSNYASTFNDKVSFALNFVINGINSGSLADTATNLAYEVTNYYASKEVERFANKNGMTLSEFNALLTLNSFIGLEIAGTRLRRDSNSNSYNIWGFTQRRGGAIPGDLGRYIGILWDINDTILGYQGLIDAVGYEFISKTNGGGTLGICHSLGTLTCNNLVARGYAPSAQLNSLPFGNVAVGTNSRGTNLGIFDLVNGGLIGFLFNPLSNFTACESIPCHSYYPNYEGKP